MRVLILTCFLIILCFESSYTQVVESSDGVNVEISSTDRIITLGGSITETVFALGFGDNIIGTDESSTYPPSIFRLPRVPYVRNITSEGILSLGSTLIISSSDANPTSAIQQIRDAGTDMILVKDEESIEGVIHKLTTVGKILNREELAASLIAENSAQYEQADSIRGELTNQPSVLFVLSAQNGSLMVAGKNTGADKVIALSGGVNVFDSFEGYKVASNESILAANPDYVLVMDNRLEEVQSAIDGTPVLGLLTAVKNDQIISMDGNLLLGFGPRFGSAILQLMDLLHPEIRIKL